MLHVSSFLQRLYLHPTSFIFLLFVIIIQLLMFCATYGMVLTDTMIRDVTSCIAFMSALVDFYRTRMLAHAVPQLASN